ncbi:MAG: hypothetical protein ABF242_03650 [Flavobacteriales bacterium]
MYKFLPNYDEHPSKTNYMVFTFRNLAMAKYFEEQLIIKEIFYETSEDEGRSGEIIYFFGVKKMNKEEVYQLNLLTHGKFRKPYFGNKYLRIILTTLLIALIALAVIGFIKN